MKKIIILLILVQLPLVPHAGKGLIKETKGGEYVSKKTDRIFGFANAIKVDDYYYAIGRKVDLHLISIIISYIPMIRQTDFIVYKLDAKMNVKAVTTIPAEFEGKSVQSFTLKRFGDKMCALFYFNNRKTHKQFLFAQQLDLETLEADGEPYKLGEMPITYGERRISCLFKVDVTPDYSKMLITGDRTNAHMSGRMKKGARSQKNHTFSYILIDHRFKMLNSGKNVKFGKGGTSIIGQTFDNLGNMCFLGFEENGGKKAKKSRKKEVFDEDQEVDLNQSKLVMKIIRTDGTETDLSFAQGQFFYSATLKLNPETGNVAVVGLLASGKYGAGGIFTQQVNLVSGEVLTESVQKFGAEFVSEINNLKPLSSSKRKKNNETAEKVEKPGKKKTPRKSSTPPDYIYRLVRLGSCHYNEENELVIVTQKYHRYTVTSVYYDAKGNRHSQTTTYYVYGDIISFKLNDEGQIENFGFIFHHHEYLADIGKDYSSLYSGQKLFLITKLEACQMELNNKVSKTQPFKTLETYKRKRGFADFVNVSDTELLHILSDKRRLTFTLMSINVDHVEK